MKALTSIGLAAGLIVSLSTAAHATPTLVGSKTDPTGINDLVVDGTTYDVMFSLTTLKSPFTAFTTASSDAAIALASALNQLLVTGLGNATVTDGYAVDVDNNPLNSASSFDAAFCGVPCTAGTWGQVTSAANNLGTSTSGLGTTIYTEAADFSAVPLSVSEPMTLGLFGTGLIALFVLRRRVNRAAS